MLVTERKWCDLILRCGGLPQVTIRIFPDDEVQSAIVDAAAKFESRINETSRPGKRRSRRTRPGIPPNEPLKRK
jgi:hypothetical protein